MSRSGIIYPLCFLLVSGCALSEEPNLTPPQSEVASSVSASQSAPTLRADDITTKAEEKPVGARTGSPEEIRRLQLALKELGLDPGPADGIAGQKTVSAFQKLDAACAQVMPLIEGSGNGAAAKSDKTFARPETIKIQTELRRAGFNVGPVDGAYGNRTRAVVTQFRSLCPILPEYAGLAASPVEASKTTSTEPNATRANAAGARRAETVKTGSAPRAMSAEEIRVLQLRLRDAGFDPGAFDGVMGPKTEKALQDYQAAHRSGKIKASLTTTVDSMY